MARILILLLSLAAGGLAAWLSFNGRAPAPVAQAAPVVAPPEEVLVAVADLAQGQRLSDASVRWQPWPQGADNAAFIKRSSKPQAVESLEGSVVRTRILSGEPVREDKLADPNAGFLAALLAAGKRAVAVRISAENTAGGFILPNDRVDVLHTATRGEGDMVSRTILTNIRVLAIDQLADDASAEGAVVGKTATLELDLGQAERIAAAEASGSLSLALRSSEDSEEPSGVVADVVQEASSVIRIIRAGRSEYVGDPSRPAAPPSLDASSDG